ncbi:sirohydrochlorin chelatase [Peribacillus muralis]|uniref:sirohydrochlorin chelatase n=1 Tax=Peribacillus muralis TaxID=264697 RepID=UPI001F4ECE54|nr:sirohydrochlorin chelatase [Peribacillus muralis]MCK1993353.1 sirohydrochlorin chelatase [Peribacillus muralis]MCK2014359.1 sirohydrochlorin chelatase [Peribacillus muralis]
MESILYICHGSRLKEASAQAIEFINVCMKAQPNKIQEYCFLELEAPTIEEAYEQCVQQGATRIIAIPVLLLTAVHAKHDIPAILTKMKKRYPNVDLNYGRPIGVSDKMVDILVERLEETNVRVMENSLVLLVGRGSSDPDVKRDLGQLADLLRNRLPNSQVKECYLTAASPSFTEALEMAEVSQSNQVFIIPYLLFTGLLMKSIQNSINNVENKRKNKFILCRYLGYHPKIGQAISERIQEVGEGAYVSNYA